MRIAEFICAAALALASPLAAEPLAAEPESVSDYELVCFCTAQTGTPHGIVQMDNNGRILKVARIPLSKAEIIARGIPVLDSQIRVLRDWHLLAKTPDGKLVTKMGVLGPAEMRELRGRLTPSAIALVRSQSGPMSTILAELHKRGQAQSAHAVLFDYVLDGLLWEALGDAGRLRLLQPSLEHPNWNGIFWAVFPKPTSSPGTDSAQIGRVDLRMMWKPGVVALWEPLANGAEVQNWMKMVDEAPAGTALPLSPAGPLRAAVIVHERAGDPIYENGKLIASATASALRATKLDDLMPFQTSDERLVIAAHEFIWLILDEASKQPGFAEPAVLREGTSDPAKLAPLLVVAVKADTTSAR